MIATMSRRLSLPLLVVLAAGALGCPAAKPPQAKPRPLGITLALVRSDLGLGDGCFVREADGVLADLAKHGVLSYAPTGELPQAQELEAEGNDVGMPDPLKKAPGSMTISQAEALLDGVKPCDMLVITSPLLLSPVLERIGEGQLSAKAVLLLDDEGLGQVPKRNPVPVYYVSYQIKDVAFLCGVAAAASSPNAMFVVLGNSADPHAQEFLSAAKAGAKYYSNGAQTFTAVVQADEDGMVTPRAFEQAHLALLKRAGPYFTCNHYILALGRATPSVMLAISKKPINGYVTGGYADYRSVRPSRILGGAVKHPGVALTYILDSPSLRGGLSGLANLAPRGVITLGLKENAVGYADLDLYSRYNPDGEDIAQAVSDTLEQMRTGELPATY